jgi:hypothetical protein
MKLILAACFLLNAGLSFAQDATLARLTGQAYIRAEGQKRYIPAKAGNAILYGDWLKTGPASIAHVVFADGSAVLVKENSRFLLSGTPGRKTVAFSVGEFLIGIKKKLLPGQSFKVRTPAAVAAVRGTLFWGKVEKDGSTQFASLKHVISVKAKGKSVILKSGQKTSVLPASAPAEPLSHDIPAEYAKTFAVEDSLQDLEKQLGQ